MDIKLQIASSDIWDTKYRLKTKSGEALDCTIDDTFKRVAKALSDLESDATWYDEFLWAMQNGAIPAGRILSNAGALEHKPATSTINCTVSGIVEDSMDSILQKVHEAGITLKSGCGIGYEFSTLRPKDAYVAGAGAYTSGPLSFMDIYDKMCFTVSSAGGRRGAQMATMCFSKNTEVLTNLDWLPIPEVVDRVKHGEHLYQVTLDGNMPISNAFENAPSQLYRVYLEDGSYLEVTEDHQFEVKHVVTNEVYLKALKLIDFEFEYIHVLK